MRSMRKFLKLIVRRQASYNVSATNIPSVYTCSALTPVFEYEKFNIDCKRLFALDTKYISPDEFKYELPRDHVPELAFVGRSNVGKSSLVRALLNNDIVRVSKEPGCTRTLNYYAFTRDSGKHELYLVDLPGYGFAKVARTERGQWLSTVDNYLVKRDFTILRRVYVLVDARRGMGSLDREMLTMLSAARVPHQVVVTKADLIKHTELSAVLNSIFEDILGKKRQGCLPIVHVVSSLTGDGVLPLKQSITEIVSQKINASDDG